VIEVKKALVLALMMACLLVVAGCGSGSQGANTVKKDYGPAEDISLSSEETEIFGVHFRLPDNSPLERSDSDENYAQTRHDLSQPLTSEIVVHINYVQPESTSYFTNIRSDEDYTPEAALNNWADEYADSENVTVKAKAYVGGTDALIITHSKKDSMTNDDYECTSVSLVMNSGYVTITYDDLGGRYGDLIQESINSIRIDEEEIPDIVRMTSPEGLRAAGLTEQPWEVAGETFGVYLNVPADFVPVKQVDGTFAWVSGDGNTTISAEVSSSDILFEAGYLKDTMSSKIPGFQELRYVEGVHNDLNALRVMVKAADESGESWINQITLADGPYPDREAVTVTITGRSADDVQMNDVMNLLRRADGWNNGGVLDMEAIAQSL